MTDSPREPDLLTKIIAVLILIWIMAMITYIVVQVLP